MNEGRPITALITLAIEAQRCDERREALLARVQTLADENRDAAFATAQLLSDEGVMGALGCALVRMHADDESDGDIEDHE